MKIEEDVALSRFTTLGTGGPARAFARPETLEELQDALGFAHERGLHIATIGLGSNLLVSDHGFDGLALKLAGVLAQSHVQGDSSSPGAGHRTPSHCTVHARPGSAGSNSPVQSRAPPAVASG